MEYFQVLLPLAIILVISKIFGKICVRIGIPQVIGLIAAGILVSVVEYIPGPMQDFFASGSPALTGLGFFAKIGVVLIMFNAGLDINVKQIKSVGLPATIITLAGVFVPMILGFIAACLIRNGTMIGLTHDQYFTNLFYGVIMTATSVSVTVATLQELGKLTSKVGTTVVTAAILDDIVGIIVLSVVIGMSGKEGGEAENPWILLGRSALFAFLIGYAKPIFLLTLKIATAPYTALMDIQMTAEDFTFAGIEQALQNGLTSLIATISVVGLLLLTILEIALGWNYFKLLLETVERYIVVGVLCYTSPLAFSMGASKATTPVFRSWCRMVGSQLLLLVMNVWFLRGFSTSVGQYIGTGGALSNGNGNVFLWLFCAVAFLKTAQKFDSYLAAMGLNVAQTGSGMGMELLMAARVITGVAGGARSAGSVFRGGSAATGTGAAATGFAAGFANRFKGNSYVRDAVVDGGTRMGAGGTIGFVGRAFGGMAARNGATLT